jgi:hypothetical protein
MHVLGITLLFASGAVGQTGAEFYHDFRTNEFPHKHFTVIEVDPASTMKREAEGLRITLSGEQKEIAGVVTKFNISGDFDITAGYEIIQAERPKTGYGVGFEIYITTATKHDITFYRRVRPTGKDVYSIFFRTSGPQGKRVPFSGPGLDDLPAAGKIGQLRIARTGPEAVLYAAEGPGNPFRELYRVPFGTDAITMLRLAANRGGTPNPLDIRIQDLRVRGDFDVPGSERARGSAFWLVAICFAVGIVAAGLLVWWQRRRNRTVDSHSPESG